MSTTVQGGKTAYGTFIDKSKNIDKSKVINNFGLDEKAVESALESLSALLIARFTEAIEESGARVTRELSGMLSSMAENVLMARLCRISEGQVASEERIIEAVRDNLSCLTGHFDAMLGELFARLDGLRADGKSLKESVEAVRAQTAHEAGSVYGEVLTTLSQFRTLKDELDYAKVAWSCIESGHFETAREFFMKAAAQDGGTAETRFGLALAMRQIQLIWDYRDNCLRPVCYDYSTDLSQDPYFKRAVQCADPKQKEEMEALAQEVESILSYFREFQDSGLDYDCFVCVKVSEEDRTETEDVRWLRQSGLYDLLERQGVRTFFSERDLGEEMKKDALKYEALILYALSRAHCMLLVCSDERYLQTPWVKNEYTRFCHFLQRRGRDLGQIVIAYNGQPIELPGGMREGYQDFDRSKGSTEDLAATIRNRVGKAKGFLRVDKKICPRCKEAGKPNYQYGQNFNYCPICNSPLMDAHEYLNAELQREEAEKAKLSEEYGRREEELARENARLTRELEEAKRAQKGASGGQKATDEELREVDKLRRRAERGNVSAQIDLGYRYSHGQGVPQDYTEAIKWFRKAAEQGDPVGEYDLALCYSNGWGVEKDEAEAFRLYTSAARKGYASAQCNLACCYGNGWGVEQDDAEAAKWYRKAALGGNTTACRALGRRYEEGIGVPKNARRAVKWYRTAARQGNAAAQYQLGLCYENGIGVRKNWGKAWKWYCEAAKRGDPGVHLRVGNLNMLEHLIAIEEDREPRQPIELPERSIGDQEGYSCFAHRKYFWPVVLCLLLCFVVTASLFFTGCSYLNLGSAQGIAYIIFWALGLAGLVALIIGLAIEWDYNERINSGVTTLAIYASLYGAAICSMVASIFHGAEVLGILPIFLYLASGLLLLVAFFYGLFVLYVPVYRVVAACLAVAIGCMSMSFGIISLMRHTFYGDAVFDGQYVYAVEEGELHFLMRDYGGDGIVIPEEYAGKRVSAIDRYNSSDYTIEYLVLPVGVTSVAASAFSDCGSIGRVFYGGTFSQWTEIDFGLSGNTCLIAAERYYYSASEPTSEEDVKYWHWSEDGKEPVIWEERA